MLSLLGKLIPSVLGNTINRVADVVSQRGSNEHDEYTERLRQSGSYTGDHRTWWDSLVDGINRLVRPCFTFGTIGLFVYSVVRPVEFHASMQALAAVPDPMWIILGTIVVFWFGEKKLAGLRKPKPPTAKEVGNVLESVRKIQELRVSEKHNV